MSGSCFGYAITFLFNVLLARRAAVELGAVRRGLLVSLLLLQLCLGIFFDAMRSLLESELLVTARCLWSIMRLCCFFTFVLIL